MKSIIASANKPITYISSGLLMTDDGFLHSDRSLSCHVLIYVTKGTLHIYSNGQAYEVKSGEYLVLLKQSRHYGLRPSQGPLTYVWLHFDFGSPYYTHTWPSEGKGLRPEDSIYRILEYGPVIGQQRFPLLLNQLLDLGMEELYMTTPRLNYAASLVLLELSDLLSKKEQGRHYPIMIERILGWLPANYTRPLSVEIIAGTFNYNPSYLSTLFKKHLGVSLTTYIQKLRINAAKALLVQHDDLPIKAVARTCGIPDEKYFLRIFKQHERMTPTAYRSSFHKEYINSK